MSYPLFFLILLSAFSALVAVQVPPAGFTDCSVAGFENFCWNSTRNVIQTNRSFVLTGSANESFPVSVAVTPGRVLFVGRQNSAGISLFAAAAAFEVGENATLGVTRAVINVTGNLTLRAGSTLVLNGDNGTAASVVVRGCLVIEAGVQLRIESSANLTNASLALRPFVVPSGCVTGSFAGIKLAFVSQSSGSGTASIAGLSCLQTGGLAIVFAVACANNDPAGAVQPPPLAPVAPPTFAVIIIDQPPVIIVHPEPTVDATGGLIINLPAIPTPLVYQASPVIKPPLPTIPNAVPAANEATTATIPAPAPSQLDVPLLIALLCSAIAVAVIVAVVVVAYRRSPAFRAKISPFSKRTYFQSAHLERVPGDVPADGDLGGETPNSPYPVWKEHRGS